MWHIIKVGDIGEIITGNTPPKNRPEYYGKEYKFIKPTDMEIGMRYTPVTEEYYSQEAFEKYKKALIPPLSTCVVTIGSIGKKITLTDSFCFTNQAVNAVIPNKENFDPLFVFYALKNILNKVKAADTGASSGRENVSKSNFASLTLSVPKNIRTQQQIASILSAHDNLIENNLKRIKLLEEATQHIYKEWFVNFRFPGYKDTVLDNGLPKGWKKDKFENVLYCKTGKLDSNAALNNGIYPFFTCSQEVFRTNTYSFDTEAVLLGGNNASGIYPLKYYKGKFDAYQRTYIIKPKDETISHKYIYFVFYHLLEYLKTASTGAATKFLTIKILNQLDIFIPDSNINATFETNISPFFDQIRILTDYNEKLKETRDILLSRLMNRTIEV